MSIGLMKALSAFVAGYCWKVSGHTSTYIFLVINLLASVAVQIDHSFQCFFGFMASYFKSNKCTILLRLTFWARETSV